MLNLQYGTPIEEVRQGGRLIRVKRDDLAPGDPLAPPLGKLRGLLDAIRGAGGVEVVGAVDRKPTSRNTWATAYLCKELGLRCHAYFNTLGGYQSRAIELGADYRIAPFLETEELYRYAQSHFHSQYGERGFLPIDDCQAAALVEDARAEVHRSKRSMLDVNTVIIPTGSGGLAMGVMKGLADLGLRPHIVLHAAGSRRSEDYLSGIVDGAGLRHKFASVSVVKQAGGPCISKPLFPCNPTYELPAWRWMMEQEFGGVVLFWNAGA